MSGLVHEAPVGASVEWFTPDWLFAALKDADGLPLVFDLDPCHPAERLSWVPARKVYTQADNGLVLGWRGLVFLNPPYGRETPRWLARMASFWAAGTTQGIALVFARTDTAWFGEAVATATAILFLSERVQFVDASGQPPLVADKRTGKMRKGSPGAGSMLIAWGNDAAAALERSDLGPVWRLRVNGTAPGVEVSA